MVGAGFAGAVIARELAESGKCVVDVIDQRKHVGGNCYDPRDPMSGVRIHLYGPHIFHTDDIGIVDYLSRFTRWIPYRHRVNALVNGIGLVPLPININTINRIYGLNLVDEIAMRLFLDRIRVHHDSIITARHVAENVFGVELTELFFGRYTRKMWGLTLDDLPAAVLQRLPIRFTHEDGYFNDQFQAMPYDGYETIFLRMLNHKHITTNLGIPFTRDMESDYCHVFNSMPIDEYFDSIHGELPYRSIIFEHGDSFSVEGQNTPTVNYTDEGPYTRVTRWDLYPGCGRIDGIPSMLSMREKPCSFEENRKERYYPVKTVDGAPQLIYAKYEQMASCLDSMTFIGRCGQYRYYDMHQVIANSRMIAARFLTMI